MNKTLVALAVMTSLSTTGCFNSGASSKPSVNEDKIKTTDSGVSTNETTAINQHALGTTVQDTEMQEVLRIYNKLKGDKTTADTKKFLELDEKDSDIENLHNYMPTDLLTPVEIKTLLLFNRHIALNIKNFGAHVEPHGLSDDLVKGMFATVEADAFEMHKYVQFMLRSYNKSVRHMTITRLLKQEHKTIVSKLEILNKAELADGNKADGTDTQFAVYKKLLTDLAAKTDKDSILYFDKLSSAGMAVFKLRKDTQSELADKPKGTIAARDAAIKILTNLIAKNSSDEGKTEVLLDALSSDTGSENLVNLVESLGTAKQQSEILVAYMKAVETESDDNAVINAVDASKVQLNELAAATGSIYLGNLTLAYKNAGDNSDLIIEAAKLILTAKLSEDTQASDLKSYKDELKPATELLIEDELANITATNDLSVTKAHLSGRTKNPATLDLLKAITGVPDANSDDKNTDEITALVDAIDTAGTQEEVNALMSAIAADTNMKAFIDALVLVEGGTHTAAKAITLMKATAKATEGKTIADVVTAVAGAKNSSSAVTAASIQALLDAVLAVDEANEANAQATILGLMVSNPASDKASLEKLVAAEVTSPAKAAGKYNNSASTVITGAHAAVVAVGLALGITVTPAA